MLGEEIKIRIIPKRELKVGDVVLFNRHKVIVDSISFDKWSFHNNDIGELPMPLYDTYYKVVEEDKLSDNNLVTKGSERYEDSGLSQDEEY